MQYKFHLGDMFRSIGDKYFDIINSEEYYKDPSAYNQQIVETIEQLYNNLVDIYETLGYDKNTLKFIDSVKEEIAYTFNKLKMGDALQFLSEFDNENKKTYTQFLNE